MPAVREEAVISQRKAHSEWSKRAKGSAGSTVSPQHDVGLKSRELITESRELASARGHVRNDHV